MKFTVIPSKFNVGGQEMEVRLVERCEDNTIGSCSLASGFIEIAERHSKDAYQSATSKKNTFYHELVHSILRTMGETDLNDNEKFVCCFAGFLTEAMTNAMFVEEEEQ